MIDLHLHTTASDGTWTPEQLVTGVVAAGVQVFSVTDHDTTAALSAVATLAARHGLTFVPGIEISAIHDGHDVHLLGYAFDPAAASLDDLLRTLRAARITRVGEIAGRLADLGAPIDVASLEHAAQRQPERSIGRPQVARALVAAGHAATVDEAFDRFLATGRPAHVTRRSVSPADVVSAIGGAGGIVSLAHPGLLRRDDWVPWLVTQGVVALEVYHSSHDRGDEQRYRALAESMGVAVSGGSDDHGPASGRPPSLGTVGLPRDDYEELRRCARRHGCCQWPE